MSARVCAQAYEQYSSLDLSGAARAGLTRVAGLLLVVFSPARAEDAFWTLVALVEDRLPASCVLKVGSPVMHGVLCLRRLIQGLFCHQWRLFPAQTLHTQGALFCVSLR